MCVLALLCLLGPLRCSEWLVPKVAEITALTAGRRLAQRGAPPLGGCPCPRISVPVCATDPTAKTNITFQNACEVGA